MVVDLSKEALFRSPKRKRTEFDGQASLVQHLSAVGSLGDGAECLEGWRRQPVSEPNLLQLGVLQRS